MKKMLWLLLLLITLPVFAQDQGESGLLFATSGPSSTIYGEQQIDNQFGGNSNYFLGSYIAIGLNNVTVQSCNFALAASTNAAGAHISCQIYPYGQVVNGAPLCTATYTASASNLGAQTISFPISGCTLSANTAYWFGLVEDDDGFSNASYDCGGSCGGDVGSSTMPGSYAPVTYGTLPDNSGMQTDVTRYTQWIVTTP